MTSATLIQVSRPHRYRGWVLPVVGVAVWWLAASQGWSDSGLLVAPQKVALTAWDQVTSGQFWRAISSSLARNLSGFFIGTVLGLILGCLLGISRRFERLVGPSFNTFKQISLFAWIPLISVWFGLGDVAKVVFLSLAALVPVVVNTCDGLRNVPNAFLEVARVYGFSRWQTIFGVMLPAALPSIFTGIYLALVYSWLATIGAEYLLVSGDGIGNTLIDGSEHFMMDLVLFGMVIIGLVGWALNVLARRLERRLQRLYGITPR
ncbi:MULTISPECIES: ABC transporter permease [unclassified Pseudomonas]|uniref:ABC transporter permease n=1 Tax=unclassified Pseudomonas TaxID=196821 RepID=UPI000D3B4FDB|nr:MULTISPECIES: ABC transporter permease [unclassified Pseudomonas]RAU44821.1 ABC transporter permease [Pseudomonas sp. RIT 409]RAU53608.1 ABC transporter permease [Pseudomonas sp. RIT 412]